MLYIHSPTTHLPPIPSPLIGLYCCAASKVKVILSDVDGAELRREKRMNPRHIRCDGKEDQHEINEALSGVKRHLFSGLGAAWDRIFGGNHDS